MPYTFPDAMRRDYESMPVPLAYYQNVGGKPMALLVSDGLCRLMRTDRPRLIRLLNESLFDRVHPDDAGRLARITGEFARHLCGYDVIYRVKYARDEDFRYVHSVGRWQTMPDGTELAVFVYSDVSDSESESSLLAENYELFQKDRFYTDPVTGLPNGNFLHEFADEKAERLRQAGRTPALIYLDVNGLRSYNNQYGYARGNELLVLIADVLKSAFPDGLVARGADDHFIVLSDESQEAELAARITAINEKVRTGAYGNTRGLQAGISRYEANDTTAVAMDHARHAFKLIGNDLNVPYRIHTTESDDDYWAQRYIIEAFDTALERQWIKVYYQAIMRLRTEKGCAMEALARWIDPSRGMIAPGVFTPVLEKYHQLYKLDLYMVERICEEMTTRRNLNLPLIPVSVNFSAQDFDHIDITEALNAILERHGVQRDSLVVEITEQDIAAGTDAFKDQLRNLRQNGYRLWLDDFGSGYSSLNVLSQFDFDLVKFDLELLRNIDGEKGSVNRHIMETMVDLLRKLGIETLAEGMETPRQKQFLRQIDCELAQGFPFYKPQPVEAVKYRLQHGGAAIPCETPEERREYSLAWMKALEGNG